LRQWQLCLSEQQHSQQTAHLRAERNTMKRVKQQLRPMLVATGLCQQISDVNEINTRIIQEVATDIGLLVKHTSDIRGKTAKIQTLTEKIEEDLDEIKAAVGNYQNKLKTAVVENGTGPITEQVESRAVNLRRYQ
jgi:hypothetical protein